MWLKEMLTPRHGAREDYGDYEIDDDASLEEENAILRKRLAATEATLARVRGEREDLERVKARMKRNSKLRRRAGGALVVFYLFWYLCWNMRFLAGYNAVRGRPA